MENKPKLKPCPWCSEQPKCVEVRYECGKFFVDCENELCRMCVTTQYFDTLEEAVLAWNTRTPTNFEIKAKEFLESFLFTNWSAEELAQILEAKSRCDTDLKNDIHIAFKIKKFLEENS